MSKLLNFTLSVFCFISVLNGQNIQSPSSFLGYDLGTQFSRHHQVVDYYKHLSKNLPSQIKLEKYGETNERRPLYLAIISSEENMNNLEAIRTNNLKNIGLESGEKQSQDVAIVWLSYNVHGNESSSTEASMLTIYELLTKKQEWLKNTIVIIDPCLNPDGRDRYVNWYNSTATQPYNTDQQASDHREPWPSGRPNHYLFDLNRDWSWLTQIESQSRIQIYNKWMPHIHVDFHEQGMDDHYYFAPAPEPYHEIISKWQREFQVEIGKNHAKYFDENGWLYFTKESFDLFYPGFGDTYPTFNGAIGMTYEQAGHGRAGLGVLNDEGELLTLKDRIKRHNTTGLSTVEVASKNAKKLNEEFIKYFNTKDLRYKSFILQGDKDNLKSLTTLLSQHDIKYGYANTKSVSGFKYSENKKGSISTSEKDIVVSTNQPKGKLVSVLFEPNGKLSDSLTYDITAWSLPYAYGVEAIASMNETPSKLKLSDKLISSADTNSSAYIFKWNHLSDAKVLSELLKNNIKVRFTSKDITTKNPERTFNKGSLIVTRADNKSLDNFDSAVVNIANKHNKFTIPVASGFSKKGPDFGSSSLNLINNKKVAVLSGEGTSSLSYGAVWHFFEQQLNYPITPINTAHFSYIELDDYDVLIMPSGNYSSVLKESEQKKLNSWVSKGGKVIAINRALNSFADKDGFDLKIKKTKDSESDEIIPYANKRRDYAKNMITGAIFKTTVDNTNPMGYGYHNNYFSLKLSNTSFELLKKGNNIAYIKENTTPVSGFAGNNTKESLHNSLVFGEERMGRGSFIYLVDDVLFRNFWENGKMFLVNAVFLVNNRPYKD